MRTQEPRPVFLKDYRQPAFLIDEVELRFDLKEDHARVHAILQVRRNPSAALEPDLVLDGEDLQLESVMMDGVELQDEDYVVEQNKLRLPAAPARFVLELVTIVRPQDNTRLEGLYKSSNMFCTQCEAEGFRRITYYLDRPDVMARFRTRIEADHRRYPVLLSNGNPVDEGILNNGRHYITWEDPFPKPAYLFALVAGDLVRVQDRFTTCSGRDIDLRMYVEPRNRHKCEHALAALKRSMRWDEEVYGREYDLDIFMIVAVDDFNMGAMENKGLNIFNSSCVLASQETATDAAYQRIESIVAHEYFHNWSGNRVTCRDWFQLSLKEGFTVFRDSEYSADMGSRTVQRIDDVNLLRTAQFAEDAGPMAHAVRPASYIEISNFYTLTVYEKGAEVVRMLHTLLGPDDFRNGCDLYFARHDGQAVTTDDFVAALAEVSGRDLTQFKRWYDQAGTPVLTIRDDYDAHLGRYTLTIRQHCPPTPGQNEKAPFHIPFTLSLLGVDGRALPLRLPQLDALAPDERVLELRETEACYVFDGLSACPVPSFLRRFSAPVRLDYGWTREQLLFLMQHDSDGFNRWDAGQQLAISVLAEEQASLGHAHTVPLDERFIRALRRLLACPETEPALLARMLQLPSEAWLVDLAEQADPGQIHAARERVLRALAVALRDELLACYVRSTPKEPDFQLTADAIAQRALRNAVLAMLLHIDDADALVLALHQYRHANNMTDQSGALRALVGSGFVQERQQCLDDFYARFQHDPQVVEQWFSIQASSEHCGSLGQIRHLMAHSAFDWRNPNKVRSVIGAFAGQNLGHFHAVDGAGYQFVAECVLSLDDRNPQLAARLVAPLTRWRKFGSLHQELMRSALERIQAKQDLSPDLFEVVSKSLSV